MQCAHKINIIYPANERFPLMDSSTFHSCIPSNRKCNGLNGIKNIENMKKSGFFLLVGDTLTSHSFFFYAISHGDKAYHKITVYQ
uniref:Uncharacterized protein n=1 Tax=Caenorhabditis japonica TaxID=281687 RepID=A0A8R1IR58_CAEJA